ncbi:MAG: right-handed parallel beta-helix repeat-containing protein [Anaeromyxobacter sp.]
MNNIVLQKYFGPVNNVTVRRSIITDAYSRGGHNSQGLFAEGVAGLTLEENVFDHNGWGNGKSASTMYHNVYVRASSSGLVARGNVFSNGSSHGLQARGGGIIENNVFINNASGLSFGLVNGSPVTPGGVTGRVVNNVFFDTHNIGANPRGVAIEIGNVKRGGTMVSGNVIANGNPSTSLPAIMLGVGSGNDNASQAVGINDLTISNNVIYNWSVGFWVNGGMAPGSGQKGAEQPQRHQQPLPEHRDVQRHHPQLDGRQLLQQLLHDQGLQQSRDQPRRHPQGDQLRRCHPHPRQVSRRHQPDVRLPRPNARQGQLEPEVPRPDDRQLREGGLHGDVNKHPFCHPERAAKDLVSEAKRPRTRNTDHWCDVFEVLCGGIQGPSLRSDDKCVHAELELSVPGMCFSTNCSIVPRISFAASCRPCTCLSTSVPSRIAVYRSANCSGSAAPAFFA